MNKDELIYKTSGELSDVVDLLSITQNTIRFYSQKIKEGIRVNKPCSCYVQMLSLERVKYDSLCAKQEFLSSLVTNLKNI